MKKRTKSITGFGIIMLIYSIWLFICQLAIFRHIFNWKVYSIAFAFRLRYPYFYPIFCYEREGLSWFHYLSLPLLLGSFLIGLTYLISSIGILRSKNWGRVISVSFSALILLSVIAEFLCEIIIAFQTLNWEDLHYYYGFFTILSTVVVPVMLPSFLFLFFFTRQEVKEHFKRRDKDSCLIKGKNLSINNSKI